jgi:hypothetical protein
MGFTEVDSVEEHARPHPIYAQQLASRWHAQVSFGELPSH